MDGTLFDYSGRLVEDLNEIRGEDDPIATKDNLRLLEDGWPCIEKRMRLIKSQVDWWRNLETIKLGWDILKIAEDIGFEIQILTKGPYRNSAAWTEKVDCIRQYGDYDINIVSKQNAKGNYYGRVLVDDFPEYLIPWLDNRPRGLAIMPAHSYNLYFQHPNCIRATSENLENVEQALLKQYNR